MWTFCKPAGYVFTDRGGTFWWNDKSWFFHKEYLIVKYVGGYFYDTQNMYVWIGDNDLKTAGK